MKSVMLSIQPKWCELIASGKKTVEVRKTRPKIDVPFKVYIYCTNVKSMNLDEYVKIHRATSGRIDDWSGKIIGEFVCDRVQRYECEFVDDDCYEEIASVFVDEDGDETGYIEWSNDGDIPYEEIDLYAESLIEYIDLKKYVGLGFNKFYGWHISELVIYDEPKEFCKFFRYCGDNPKCDGCEAFYYSNTECGKEEYCCSIIDGYKPLKRPPQSWCYVERKEDEGK